jgi:hypothetical protein
MRRKAFLPDALLAQLWRRLTARLICVLGDYIRTAMLAFRRKHNHCRLGYDDSGVKSINFLPRLKCISPLLFRCAAAPAEAENPELLP